MSSSTFTDRVCASIEQRKSCICAGFDPQLEDIPAFLIESIAQKHAINAELIYHTLVTYYAAALEALHTSIAAVKPNIAFFEQYGVSGVRAFADIIGECSKYGLPVIADVKRGDIGTTAQAYSRAYLGTSLFRGSSIPAFAADAITVNPFLGFDTIEPFIKECIEHGKGIFVLVRTSNPGASDIQGFVGAAGDVSRKVAHWLHTKAELLRGVCGYSGLGAVVGATAPDQAKQLRAIMPTNFFLVPGFGAQGGSARDAVSGFANGTNSTLLGGAVINISRGLFGSIPTTVRSVAQFRNELSGRIDDFNRQIAQALAI